MKSARRGGLSSDSAWGERLLGHAGFLADSALEPGLFESLASRLQRDYPYCIGILVYGPDGAPTGEAAFVGPVRGAEAVYLQHFAAVNPYPAVVRRHRLENRTVVFSDWYPLAEWHRTEYFNDFIRKNDGDYFLALSLSLPEIGRTSITLTRNDAAGGDFGPADVRRLDGLRPFLRNAILLRSLWKCSARGPKPGPDSLDRPALLLREGKPPRALNAPAETLLRDAGERGGAAAASAAGTHRFAASAFPGLSGSARSSGALVAVLSRTESAPDSDEGLLLCRAFGLTPAQARVAADLLTGLSNREIAESRGVSLNTVGSHVKAIHQKVGIRSSRQLFGVVRRLPRTPR